jgi:hypothetical protein
MSEQRLQRAPDSAADAHRDGLRLTRSAAGIRTQE